jgi:DNA replication protein DnaC
MMDEPTSMADFMDGVGRWAADGAPRIFDQAKPEDVPQIADLLKGGPRDVLILGPNGTGKSHAAAILSHIWGAYWCSVMKLLVRIRHTYSRMAEESEATVLEDVCTRRVLVLDDLMAASKTEHGLSTVLYVVDTRLNTGMPTIVTCEKKLAAVDKWDSSMASRLLAYYRIELAGKDRRRAQGK